MQRILSDINAKKTKCMKFELKPVMPKTYPIRLEGNVLEWTKI